MKNIFSKILTIAGAALIFHACETDPELKNPADLVNSDKSEQYYENLRAYKKTDHPIAFGWYGHWLGSGASLENSLMGLPDSVDVISLWGCWQNPTPEKRAELEYVQRVKGLRAMMCFIVSNVGSGLTPKMPKDKADAGMSEAEWRYEFWGYNPNDEESTCKAAEKYANAICDTIDKYNYDGFDYDYEPHYGGAGDISRRPVVEKAFVSALAKRLGPLSGSGKLLAIDGEPQSIPSELGPCFDYFIVQAYGSYGDADLDRRIRSTINNFDGYLTAEEVAKKYIVAENFESYAATGGVNYTDRYGNRMMSLEGMAHWTPIVNGKKVQKGGVGTYHMEYEYNAGKQPSYPAMRKAIQVMNPAIH